MPDTGVYAFSVRKTTPWRNKTQGFSNLYHYFLTTPTEAALQNVLTKLVTIEKTIHSTAVSFVEGRAWGPVNPNGSGGRMEAVITASGTGAVGPSTTIYKECCQLIVYPLGRYGVKNRPQFMRKWYHLGQTSTQTANGTDGNTDISPATGALATAITDIASLVPTGGGPALPLQTSSGHTNISPGFLYKYLEHHQFGR